MIKFKEGEALQIKGGNVHVLLQKLKDADDTIIKGLKNMKDQGDMRYHQGASSVIDSLIKILM